MHNWDEEQRWSRRVPRLVKSSFGYCIYVLNLKPLKCNKSISMPLQKWKCFPRFPRSMPPDPLVCHMLCTRTRTCPHFAPPWARRGKHEWVTYCSFTWEMVQKAWASTTLCLCHSTQIMNSSMVCDCLLSDRVADMVTHVLNLWSVVCAWPLTETTSATMPTVLVVCCKICHDPYV